MSGPNKGEVYTCSHCRRRFVTERDDSEAREEAAKNFQQEADEIVCEDCCRLFVLTDGPS